MTFVQATVVDADAKARRLDFVDASGRTRSHPVAAPAAARLARLRAGDAVIVVLAGAEPVVQEVRVSQATAATEPSPAPTPAASPAPDERWTVVPAHTLRPAWPNPYSRFYRGRKPAPPRP